MTKNEFFNAMKKANVTLTDLTEGSFEYYIRDPLYEYFKGKVEFDIHSGASKLAIIPEHEDYVIKCPFAGEAHEDFDEDTGEYFEEIIRLNLDYCEREYENYRAATQNFPLAAKMLAPVDYLGDIDGVGVYVQVKCHAEWYSTAHTPSDESIKTAFSICDKVNGYCFNEMWLGEAIDAYGEEAVEQLIYFLEQNNINDLHSGNIGYYQGKPILFDYSGYFN